MQSCNKIFNEETPENLVSDSDAGFVPKVILFKKLALVEIGTKNDDVKKIRYNNDVGGAFFKYIAKYNTPKIVVNYLKRLQIFDTLYETCYKYPHFKLIRQHYSGLSYESLLDQINEEELIKYHNFKGNVNKQRILHYQRSELNDNCFIYALIQTNEYTNDELNKMRLRIKNRYLHKSVLNDICNEYMIHIKLSYTDDETSSKDKRSNQKIQSKDEKKNYMGVAGNEAKHIHKFVLYQNHY